MDTFTPRDTCFVCMRPRVVCWCAAVPKIEARTKLLVLQHPREEFMPIGTARMAALSVVGAELVVGTALDDHPSVRRALEDPARPAVLLWPGPASRDLALHAPAGPTTLVVVDGTWPLAKKLVRLNPRVAALPQYALTPTRPSDYRIRKEPRATCVSTIEAVIEALAILDGAPDKFDAMREPFRRMIDTQIAFAAGRTGAGRHLPKGPKKPPRTPAAFKRPRDVVVLAGEANAWPYGTPDRPAQELVHLVATRLPADLGAPRPVFDALVAPRGALSPTTMHHARVSEAELRAGLSLDAFHRAWRAFVRDDDVVAFWGPHAATLLIAEGGFLPAERVDLRRATVDYLKDTSPSIMDAALRLGVTHVAIGSGRAGSRLGSAVAIAEHLLRAAQHVTHAVPTAVHT
ncbi:MAG: tRNA-uridine aminocarboxypropyltransferase [Polyangiaceae bacterium]